MSISLLGGGSRESSKGHIEFIGVRFDNRDFVGVYISPKHEAKADEISWCFETFTSKKSHTLFLGDFNADFSKVPSSVQKVLQRLHLNPLVRRPTTTRGTCIDNCVTTIPRGTIFASVYDTLSSDHLPIVIHGQMWSETSPTFSEKKSPVTSTRETTGDILLPFHFGNRARQAHSQLKAVRRKILAQNDQEPFDEWEWVIFFRENHVECEELLEFVFALTDDRETHTNALLGKREDLEAISHLPEPIKNNYKPLATRGDGSCLFNAVSLLISGSDTLAPLLRYLSLYVMVKHREKLTSFGDQLLLEEAARTSKMYGEEGCENMEDCFSDFLNLALLSEVCATVIVNINYSFGWRDEPFRVSAAREPFADARDMTTLNSLISQNANGCANHRYIGYLVRENYAHKETLTVSLSSLHYTALLRKPSGVSVSYVPYTAIKFD